MSKRFSVIFSVLAAVLILGLSASASEPWFLYDQDAAMSVIVSVYKARVNEDYSVTVVFKVTNAGDTLVENFTMTKASVMFGENTFYLNDQISGKNIKSGVTKKYSVKIPSDIVPESLKPDEIKTCHCSIEYSYATGQYWHIDSTSSVVESYAYI